MSVLNDARQTSLGGATRDGLFNKLQGEFMGERVSSTRRAEDKLRFEVDDLAALAAALKGGASAEATAAFNARRKAAMKLRFELIVQREVSGLGTNAAATVEADFPLPASL
jgi:hypothetical protein